MIGAAPIAVHQKMTLRLLSFERISDQYGPPGFGPMHGRNHGRHASARELKLQPCSFRRGYLPMISDTFCESLRLP
jgi:hypothetical protein